MKLYREALKMAVTAVNWWNISVFGIIPVLTVTILFLFKKKHLWTAPLFSAALSIAVSIIAMPSILSDSEHKAMFFGIVIPVHTAVVIGLTIIIYTAAHVFNTGRMRRR